MKKKFIRHLFFCLALLPAALFVSCPEEPKQYAPLEWENIYTEDLKLNENCTLGTDNDGNPYWKYSYFDKNTDKLKVNNVHERTLGTDLCGFQGYMKYGSGEIYDYGFLFNMDLENNTYYMVTLSPNGTFTIRYYIGEKENWEILKEVPQDSMKSVYSFNANEWTKIKVETAHPLIPETEAESDVNHETQNLDTDINQETPDPDKPNLIEDVDSYIINIYVNNKLIYTIENPKNLSGAIGICQMLDLEKCRESGKYSEKMPLVSLFQFEKIQHY